MTTTGVPTPAKSHIFAASSTRWRTQPELRKVPSCSSVWIGLPFRRTGIEWNPIASVRPFANRTMYCIETEPLCALDTGDREYTEYRPGLGTPRRPETNQESNATPSSPTSHTRCALLL